MCLSIPGKLTEITAELDETFRIGKVDFDGIKKRSKPRYGSRSQNRRLCASACGCCH